MPFIIKLVRKRNDDRSGTKQNKISKGDIINENIYKIIILKYM